MNDYYGYVYKMTNKLNNKIYVGKRKSAIFDEQYWGGGKIIAAAVRKYGKENFDREILEWCESKQQLEERERFWITELHARDLNIGYNLAEGGEGGITYSGENPRKGKRMSDEARHNMSVSHKGLSPSEETRYKMSISHTEYWKSHPEQIAYYKEYFKENSSRKGKHHSAETIEIIRQKNLGKEPWNKGKTDCYSEETRYAMGASMRGKEPWNKGKIGCYSPKTIEQLRRSHTGKKQSAETIQKRTDKLKGKPRPAEVRRKISEATLGHKWTEEQKIRQRERMKNVTYKITCKRCGQQFMSSCSASRYCDSCRGDNK